MPSKQNNKETPVGALSYNGPIVRRSDVKQRTLTTIVMTQEIALTTTVGGVLNNVFSSNPTGTTDWGDAQMYDEYRTLGYDLLYMPNDRYDSGLTTNQLGLAAVADHNGNAPLTSYAQASAYPSLSLWNTGDPIPNRASNGMKELAIRMNGVGEAVFVNTANAPGTLYYIKFFATGLQVSHNYGVLIQRFIVQFRGKGI